MAQPLSLELSELAAAYGVATRYRDWRGVQVHVSESTVVAVLRALGVDASTRERAKAALERHRSDRWRQMLPPCVVVTERATAWFAVHVRHGDPVEVWVELESGGVRGVAQQDRWVEPTVIDGRLVGEATFELPGDLPLGWHRLRARSPRRQAEVPLVVTPRRLPLPVALEDRRVWGYQVPLYALRSRRSWGLGDLDDLADLAAWAARELGAGFVLVNPLHAAEPVPPLEPSPYLPATRRFAHPLYLRVEAVPEIAYLPAAARARIDALAASLRGRNELDEPLDRDTAWVAKSEALALLHAVPLGLARRAAYDAFCEREGQGLVDYATWCALVEVHGRRWTDWPTALQDPRSPAVAAERERLADRVDFHRWLQWLLDHQLARAQRRALDNGMPVGVLHGLAAGVHASGSDTWSLGQAVACGVTVGTPPDAANPQGQDWGQLPWRADQLAASGYAPYRDMLRSILRHAGGIRVDHVVGLFRLWWIPEGATPAEGTYVRYDHEALVGILALEAHRAGALVVGEDLGVVEPWVRDLLRERGIFGTSILWFERDPTGRPRDPGRWRELCLATVTMDGLPPTLGHLRGLRGLRGDHAELRQWRVLLGELGLLRPGAGEQETVEVLHRFLLRTPARLIGVALCDAIGDGGAAGTNEGWRLPLLDAAGKAVLLDDLGSCQRVRSLGHVFGGVFGGRAIS